MIENTYILYYTKDACSDYKKVAKSDYKHKVDELLELLKINPFQNPPPFKKLIGLYDGAISRRINLKHRLFYQVDTEAKTIKILRMCSHYGDN